MQDNISESVKVQWKPLFQELQLRCPYSVSMVLCLQCPPCLSLWHKQFCFFHCSSSEEMPSEVNTMFLCRHLLVVFLSHMQLLCCTTEELVKFAFQKPLERKGFTRCLEVSAAVDTYENVTKFELP